MADCHLDSSFAGLGFAAPLARERAEEVKEAFAAAIALGRREGVQIALIAGDLFESRSVRRSTLRFIAEQLGSLPAAVFVAPGNHDPNGPASHYRAQDWPPNVHVFGPRWEVVRLPELGVAVHGFGFDRYEVREPALAALRRDGAEPLQIALVHGSLVEPGGTGAPGTPPFGRREEAYLPFTAAELRAAGMDYVALGHYHRHLVALRDGPRVLAQYPGPPESLDFGDRGPHGVLVGWVGSHGCELRLERVGRREHLSVDCDATGAAGEADLAARIRAAVPAESRARDLCRVVLRGAIDPTLQIDLHALGRRLEGDFRFLRLEDQTRPDFDVEALSAEHGVRGAFVRRLLQRAAAAEAAGDHEAAARAREALGYGLDALAGQVHLR